MYKTKRINKTHM